MTSPPFEYAVLNAPLASRTLYNVGGAAHTALFPRNVTEVREAYAWMLSQDLPRLILGGGTNVLISDKGFPGIVLFATELRDFEELGGHRYYIGSGNILDWVVREIMLKHNYEGVGGLTGIPGSVGGAIYMNAGTVNGSMCQFMESVTIMNSNGLQVIPMDNSLYTYRGQTFCSPGDIILGGHFQYAVSEIPQRPIYDHYIQRRKDKQPQGRCCGSVFKNPQGDHSGRLIEACGLKGSRHGGAHISEMHANFIMNDNNASFEDIIALIKLAKETVKDKFGVTLEEEVQVIG